MKKIFSLTFLLLILQSCGNSELKKSIKAGAVIYEKKCAKCHFEDGKGEPIKTPPLANSNWLTEKRKESIHATKYGLRGPIEVNGIPYDRIQIPMNLSDQEVMDVLNYVMNSWGNTQEKMVTLEEVQAVPKKMKR